MEKRLLLKYIEDAYKKNKHLYTFKYFKTIKNIFDNIEVNSNLTEKALYERGCVFTQNYDLGNFGIYNIDFNILQIIELINLNQIYFSKCTNKDINFDTVYHEIPRDFSVHTNYDSKIIITDFITKQSNYTMIDGNHTFEKNKHENIRFYIHYIPFHMLSRNCYCNDFSYVFHYIMNEFNIIFIENFHDFARQKAYIKNSKVYYFKKELF